MLSNLCIMYALQYESSEYNIYISYIDGLDEGIYNTYARRHAPIHRYIREHLSNNMLMNFDGKVFYLNTHTQIPIKIGKKDVYDNETRIE